MDLERAVIDDRIHLAIGYFGRRLELLTYEALFRERQELLLRPPPRPVRPLPERGLPGRPGTAPTGWPVAILWARTSAASPRPNTTATASHMEAIATLILSGHHIGYLPDHYARPWVEADHLRPIRPNDLGYEVTFDLVARKGRRQSAVLLAFMQDLKAAHDDRQTDRRGRRRDNR